MVVTAAAAAALVSEYYPVALLTTPDTCIPCVCVKSIQTATSSLLRPDLFLIYIVARSQYSSIIPVDVVPIPHNNREINLITLVNVAMT